MQRASGNIWPQWLRFEWVEHCLRCLGWRPRCSRIGFRCGARCIKACTNRWTSATTCLQCRPSDHPRNDRLPSLRLGHPPSSQSRRLPLLGRKLSATQRVAGLKASGSRKVGGSHLLLHLWSHYLETLHTFTTFFSLLPWGLPRRRMFLRQSFMVMPNILKPLRAMVAMQMRK